MASIHYLRPQDRPTPDQPSRDGESPRLRVAISHWHLAAVLLGETIMRHGIVPPKSLALAERLSGSAPSAPPPPSRHRQVAAVRKPQSAATLTTAFANAVSAAVDAFIAVSVVNGTLELHDVSRGGNESLQAALRLKSEFIGVPDDIIVARQSRTRQVAFAFPDLDTLGATLSAVLRHERLMVENWAAGGGRFDLHLKHQARVPFGRIAHVGASAATDLRAIAIRLSREIGVHGPYCMAELSLTPRGR